MNKKKLHETIGMNSIDPKDLFAICVQVARKYGTKNLLGSKRLSVLYDEPLDYKESVFIGKEISNNGKQSAPTFLRTLDISWIEALNLCWIAHYFKRNTPNDITHLVGIEVDTKYLPQTELMLSDGVLVFVKGEELIHSQIFQQTIAQNIYGSNRDSKIEEEAIKQINAKAAKRDSYAVSCGLGLGIITENDDIDIERIITESNADTFYPSYAVVYKDNFSHVEVYPLNKKWLELSGTIEDYKYFENATLLPASVKTK